MKIDRNLALPIALIAGAMWWLKKGSGSGQGTKYQVGDLLRILEDQRNPPEIFTVTYITDTVPPLYGLDSAQANPFTLSAPYVDSNPSWVRA